MAIIKQQEQQQQQQRNKRLEGVSANPALTSLYNECLAACKQKDSKPLLTTVSTDSEGSPSAAAAAAAADARSIRALLRPLSLEDAATTVLEFEQQSASCYQKNTTHNTPSVLPMAVLRAMQVVLQQQSSSPNETASNNLEAALTTTQLAFTAPSANNNNKNNKKFHDRMERLRLQNEESKYYKLTSNIDAHRNQQEDGITTKSMTYAASVGLNMIVAPLSFGVFMYFFSGPVLSFLFSAHRPSHPGAVDIRKVIIGVVSGVGMLFVEMLLFVIRTHEFEKGMRRKQRRKGTSVRPFGDYSSASSKTYTTDNPGGIKTTNSNTTNAAAAPRAIANETTANSSNSNNTAAKQSRKKKNKAH